MKKTLLTFTAITAVFTAMAQIPEDVLRYSYHPQHGSARNMAIGGAMGSLGGDINALYVNPAGLGLYKTSEFVLSPAVALNNNKSTYFGTSQTAKKSAFDLGTSGFVVGFNQRGSKWTSQAFSLGINQTANFNNIISYHGQNAATSYSEQYTEELSSSGLSINQALNTPAFAYSTALALDTYLIDTFRTSNNDPIVKGLPEFLLDKGIALDQQKTIETKGGIYEIGLGYASNMDDKLYLGASVGIPIVSYERNTTFREADISGNTNNNFAFSELNDKLTTKGAGINLKLGLIYKVSNMVRLGVTLHTPTYYSLTDRQTAEMATNTEAYSNNHILPSSSLKFTNGSQGETRYNARTPFKAIFSGSYVFREVSDTRQQRGFISADIEYIGYPSTNFSVNAVDASTEDHNYYNDLKTAIKSYYKGAVNFRLGGELKFNTLMVRVGGAYYGNPYKQDNKNEQNNLKSNIIQAGGGIGYRNHGVFVDLTYAHIFNKDVNFPYRLTDNANFYAEQKANRGNIVMTVGFKL